MTFSIIVIGNSVVIMGDMGGNVHVKEKFVNVTLRNEGVTSW